MNFLHTAFQTILSGSWRTSLVILALAVIRLLVRGRIPAQLWFVAWIVIAARLLVPVTVPAAWSPFNLGKIVSRNSVPASTMVSAVADRAMPSLAKSLPADLPPTPARVFPPPPRPRFQMDLVWLWPIGAAALLLTRMIVWFAFRRRLQSSQLPANGRLAGMVTRCASALGLTGSPDAVETTAVDGPALFGILRPQLLFPPGFAASLSDDELRLVVLHELGHWRRRDLLSQALMQGACALHWFNPLVWLATRLARQDCEFACDEFVIRSDPGHGAEGYGAVLLKVLGVMRSSRRPAPLLGILENRAQLKRRLQMIVGYQSPSRARALAGAALLAILGIVSLTRETRAQNTAPAPTPVTTVPAPNASPPALPPFPASMADPLTIGTPDAFTPDTGKSLTFGKAPDGPPDPLVQPRGNKKAKSFLQVPIPDSVRAQHPLSGNPFVARNDLPGATPAPPDANTSQADLSREEAPGALSTKRVVRILVNADGLIFVEGETTPLTASETHSRLQAYAGSNRAIKVDIESPETSSSRQTVGQLVELLRHIEGLTMIVGQMPADIIADATRVKSPPVGAQPPEHTQTLPFVLVTITADGSMYVDNDITPLDLPGVYARLRAKAAENPNTVLRIQADPVATRQMVRLINGQKEANLGLSVVVHGWPSGPKPPFFATPVATSSAPAAYPQERTLSNAQRTVTATLPSVVIRGEVAKPGRYDVDTRSNLLTVADLITKAGGFTDQADEKVQIVRRHGNDATVVYADVGAVFRGQATITRSLLLEPDDVVTVRSIQETQAMRAAFAHPQSKISIQGAVPNRISAQPAAASATISVDQEGNIIFNDKQVTEDELQALLRHLHDVDKDVAVLIKADETSPLKKVAFVWDACNKAGLNKFSMQTR